MDNLAIFGRHHPCHREQDGEMQHFTRHACCAAVSRQKLALASYPPRQHGAVDSQARHGW